MIEKVESRLDKWFSEITGPVKYGMLILLIQASLSFVYLTYRILIKNCLRIGREIYKGMVGVVQNVKEYLNKSDKTENDDMEMVELKKMQLSTKKLSKEMYSAIRDGMADAQV